MLRNNARAVGLLSEWRILAVVLTIFWVVVAWVTIAATRDVTNAMGLVAHTHRVMHDLSSLQSRITDVETAQRGYVITGDSHYLEPVQTAQSDTATYIRDLQGLVADNMVQSNNLRQLSRTATQRLGESQNVIALRRDLGLAAAQERVEGGLGKALHDQLRAEVRTMRDVEQALLETRQSAADHAHRNAQIGLLLALTMVAGAIVAAVWMARARAAATKRLTESESRYRALFDANPLPILVVDRTGRDILFANEAASLKYGYPQSGITALSVDAIFAASEHPRLIERLAQTVASGRSTHALGYWSHCTKDGRELRADVTFHPIDFNGADACMLIAQDVTDREKALEALKSSEQRFFKIFDQQVQFMALVRPSGMIVMANELFVAASRLLHPHVLGSNIRALSAWNRAGDLVSDLSIAFERFCNLGDTSSFELTIVDPQGVERVLEASFRAMPVDANGIEQILFQAHDVTARARGAEALANSERRLNAAQQRVSLGSWEYDLLTGDAWWSDFTFQMFDVADHQIPRGIEGVVALIHPDDNGRLAMFIEGLRDAIGPSTLRLRRHPDIGEPCHIEIVAETVYDVDGNAIRLVGSVLDITERLAIEGRLQQSQRLEAVGKLTGGIAHDFNNLLTIIIGNSEALNEGVQTLDPAMAELAELSLRAALRGSDLTQQLLAFARRQPLEPQVIEPHRLITDVRPLIAKAINASIDLEIVTSAGGWRVFVDPAQLESAILNLALNARDAMPDGGRLTIEIANTHLDQDYSDAHLDIQPGQYVMIAVSDTGTGMTREVIDRAFEPFFSTKRQGARSGLGLSMVHGFIKQSGGHIKIYSELDSGTTIKIYLRRSIDAVSATEKLFDDRSIPRGDEHILLVEDDVLVRDHVANQLRKLGYTVSSADGAASALEALEKNGAFDLLFTDVVMPGGPNGRELAATAHENWPEMPVLFTSGYTENAIVHHGRLDEGAMLLTKPYRLRTLAVKVRRAIESSAVKILP